MIQEETEKKKVGYTHSYKEREKKRDEEKYWLWWKKGGFSQGYSKQWWGKMSSIRENTIGPIDDKCWCEENIPKIYHFLINSILKNR